MRVSGGWVQKCEGVQKCPMDVWESQSVSESVGEWPKQYILMINFNKCPKSNKIVMNFGTYII